jgi:tripartite-type tricarboxylate transporter receptor subunit TctC
MVTKRKLPTHQFIEVIKMKRRLMAFVIPALLVATGLDSRAQDAYPNKPIVAIVAFPAGGGTDIIARAILRTAEKYAGQGFVVDNKPGGGGAIGFTAFAGAPKDGYTIGFINAPTIVLNPIQLADKVRYKLDDFVPIANFVNDPGVFAVPADSPYKTLKDFVDFAKANPNKVRLGYGGPGTSEALAVRTLEQATGITIRKVPFAGTGPQVSALMGNHIDIMISSATDIYAQHEAKSIRVIAIGAAKRIDLYPGVPTYKESGFDYVQDSMRGMAVPKGMDPKQIQFLADVMKKSFDDPGFQENAKKLHLALQYMGPEDFMKELKRQDVFYRAEFAKNPW